MKGRILYIEDDKDLAKVIAEDLLFEGFHIVWGEDIKTMYKLLEEDSWDVLLLDLELKQQNTLQEIPKIRKKYPFLKIVVASSNVLGTVIRQCDESGTDDYLKKPYDIEEVFIVFRKSNTRNHKNRKLFVLATNASIGICGRNEETIT